MAVRLERTIKRYIGSSADLKPIPKFPEKLADNEPFDLQLPPGSSFLESDTGKIYRWDGVAWVAAEDKETQEDLLAALLFEVRLMREEFKLMLAS